MIMFVFQSMMESHIFVARHFLIPTCCVIVMESYSENNRQKLISDKEKNELFLICRIFYISELFTAFDSKVSATVNRTGPTAANSFRRYASARFATILGRRINAFSTHPLGCPCACFGTGVNT